MSWKNHNSERKIVYAIAGLSLGIGAVLWGVGRYIEESYKNKESNALVSYNPERTDINEEMMNNSRLENDVGEER